MNLRGLALVDARSLAGQPFYLPRGVATLMKGAMFIVAAFLDNITRHLHGPISGWTLFGLLGNGMFTSRFVVQWYTSERLKQSVIPKNFWHLSLVGGVMQVIYAVHIGYIPVILGYLLTPVIAARNLMLMAKKTTPPASQASAPLPDEATGTPVDTDRPPTSEHQKMGASAVPLAPA